MLRPPLTTPISFQQFKASLRTYLSHFTNTPQKTARLLAVFIIPTAAIVWWYYSVAMSIAAIMPQVSVTNTEETLMIEPQPISEIPSSPSSTSTSTHTTDTTTHSATTDLQINGQQVPVPDDGSVHKVIQSEDGSSTVDISIQSNTSGSNKSHSSSRIQTDSSTSIRVETNRSIEEVVK